MICEEEGVSFQPLALDQLVDISAGDLRKSITLLQSLSCSGEAISREAVREISGYVPDGQINKLMAISQSGEIKQLMDAVKQIIDQGYSAYQTINQLADRVLCHRISKMKDKTKIFDRLGVSAPSIENIIPLKECERRLIDGADEFLQLLDLMAIIHNCFFQTK